MTVKETKPAAEEKRPTNVHETCGVKPVDGAGPVITAVSERAKETMVQGIVVSTGRPSLSDSLLRNTPSSVTLLHCTY